MNACMHLRPRDAPGFVLRDPPFSLDPVAKKKMKFYPQPSSYPSRP